MSIYLFFKFATFHITADIWKSSKSHQSTSDLQNMVARTGPHLRLPLRIRIKSERRIKETIKKHIRKSKTPFLRH